VEKLVVKDRKDDTATDQNGSMVSLLRPIWIGERNLKFFDPTSSEDMSPIRKYALLGFLGAVLVFAGSLQRSSPFDLKQPCAWFFGVPRGACAQAYSPAVVANELYFAGIACVYAGLFMFMRAWYLMSKYVASRPGMPVKYAAAVFVLWVIPLIAAPPLFSRDAYSYAGQGEMLSRGISPYKYGVSVLGPYSSNPYIDQVDPLWKNTPVPYGPLELQTSSLLANISGHNELVNVLLLRLVMCIVSIGFAAFFIPRIAKKLGRDPSEVLILAICNPLVIFHLIGGIHNDAMMIAFLVPAVAFALESRYLLSAIFLALSIAVKAPAAVAIGFIAWYWAGSNVTWPKRALRLLQFSSVCLVTLEIISLESGLGWRWINDLGAPDTVRSWLAPATGLGIGIFHLSQGLGIFQSVSVGSWLHVSRSLGVILAGILCVYFCVTSIGRGLVSSLGISLVAVVLCGPVVQPWYLTWGIVLLALAARGKLWATCTILSIVSMFLGLPGAKVLLGQLDSIYSLPAIVFLFFVVLGPYIPKAIKSIKVIFNYKKSLNLN
jgi:hypothetical protein